MVAMKAIALEQKWRFLLQKIWKICVGFVRCNSTIPCQGLLRFPTNYKVEDRAKTTVLDS